MKIIMSKSVFLDAAKKNAHKSCLATLVDNNFKLTNLVSVVYSLEDVTFLRLFSTGYSLCNLLVFSQ